MKEAPFKCSRKVEKYLTRALSCGKDTDPAIVVTMGMKEYDNAGTLVSLVNGIHFTVGYYPKGERESSSLFMFRGKPVSIMQTTLKYLENRHLVLVKPDWTKKRWFVKKSILKAEPEQPEYALTEQNKTR